MKSLLRWTATVSLVGSAVLGAWFGNIQKALALPTEQILQTLNPIPVFTVADSTGAPLVAQGDDNTKIAGVFISQGDAEAFITRLRGQNPQLASQVRVVPLSLGEVFTLAEDSKNDGLKFAYVPTQAEIASARSVAGDKYQGGVPLFVARGGQQNGYLTIEQDNKKLIPFFFEQSQVQQVVDRFKQQQPNMASTVSIEVVPLENVIATLQQSNDQVLTNIILIPTQESINFLQSVQQQSNQGNPNPSNNTPNNTNNNRNNNR